MFHLYGAAKKLLLLPLLLLLFLSSCTVVLNYPKSTPFVYENKISLTGDIAKDDKKKLEVELPDYWDDSLKAVRTGHLFYLKKGIYPYAYVLKNPPPLDSIAISRSISFMTSYLQSQGYYNAIITPAPVKIDTIKNDQYRATVQVNILLQKNLKIDSISYDSIYTPELQKLAKSHSKESLLRKNEPFTKSVISTELTRLVSLFREHGYFKFTKENLYAEVDTTDPALLEVTLDPFEQARKIAEAEAKRKQNPTINVVIKQRASQDTSAFTKYYVGKITYYPETKLTDIPDSVMNSRFALVRRIKSSILKQNAGMVVFQPLREHTYMIPGTVWNEQSYFRTLNALSQLGPWNQVDVRTLERKDSLNLLDFNIFLTPANRYSFGYDLEVSRNSGSIIAGNLLGLSNVFSLRDRNVNHRAIQSTTSARAGVELGFSDTLLQTFQASVSQTFSFPRFLFRFKNKNLKKYDDYRTLVNVNGSFTDRRNFFRLRSGTASFGYEWKIRKHSWIMNFMNVELYSLDTLPGLLKAFQTNPFLRTAFNTGYVIGGNATYNLTFQGRRDRFITHNIRVSGEVTYPVSVAFSGLKNKIYQYIKLEGEYRWIKQYRKTALASRFFGGIGYNYNNDPVLGQSLPFFKQFVAGGPYSMRAWGVRQLGLGSSLKSDTSSIFRDRFGDVQLELNFEYRFTLFTLAGYKVNSALFTDMGNIWNLKTQLADVESQLKFNRFWRDIAIAAGTGIRIDFNYAIIRVDFAYKVKDPARLSNGGWMSIKDFEWKNKEFNNLGINRNNFAFQLGIGLPF